jgi:uncharacterized membrane protein YphA (DoxX/SURF4 family)
MLKRKNILLFLFSLISTTAYASAHEVYVLSKDVIAQDTAIISPNPFSIITADENLFIFWGFISIVAIILVLFFSLNKKIEQSFDPFLFNIKKYAHLVARITFGSCLIASAYYGALFGPELPFSNFVGEYTSLLSGVLYFLGISIILGFLVRACSFIVFCIFLLGIKDYGIYMLTYSNYLGEILINLILGAGAFSIDSKFFQQKLF